MSKPSEHGFTRDDENLNYDEGFFVAEERSEVKFDGKPDVDGVFYPPSERSEVKIDAKPDVDGVFYPPSERSEVKVDGKPDIDGVFYPPSERSEVKFDGKPNNNEGLYTASEVSDVEIDEKTDVDEGFYTAKERSKVVRDEKTVGDDAGDYVFIVPRRKKRHKKRSSSSKGNSHKTSDSLVSSRRSSSGHHHHRSHHRRRRKKWKKAVIAIACILMALVIIFTGTMAILLITGHNQLFTEDVQIVSPDGLGAVVKDDGDIIYYNGSTYKYNRDVTSILFMGVDKRDLELKTEQGTGGQADVIVLLALDLKKRKLSLLNIPRDTITDVAIYSAGGEHFVGMQKQQICLSYAYGDGKEKSCNNTLASVRRIFYNVPVNTYYSLDLDGIAAVNDAIGGVDVVSPETIGNFTEGQTYHLLGTDAESFVRTRTHERADANMLRMKRQQTYANSFMNKVMTEVKRDPAYATDLFTTSSPYSCTDLTVSKVLYLAQDIARNGSLSAEMLTVPGKTTLNANEQAEYHISEKDFYEQFLSVFYDKLN